MKSYKNNNFFFFLYLQIFPLNIFPSQSCPKGFTTSRPGSTASSDCSLPICLAGEYLDAVTNQCTLCGLGFYQV